jgi:O-antigen ligase
VGPSQPDPALLAAAVFVVWTIVDHPEQALDPTGLRVPVLVLLGTLTALIAARCTAAQRAMILDGLVVIGMVQALGAIVQVAATVTQHGIPPDGLRAASLLGNANALGVLLVATFLVTLARMPKGAWALLAVQGLGVLLTGSRLAVGLGLVVAVAAAVRGPLRRWWGVVACWIAVAVAVLVDRFAASGADRLALWQAALGELVHAPIAGRGPAPAVYQVAGIGPTTHAHNEALQIAVEYGVIGLGLLVLTVILAARAALRSPCDGLLLAAAAALAACGLTDFGLRIPGIALTVAMLLSAARRPETAAPQGGAPPSVAGSGRPGSGPPIGLLRWHRQLLTRR